MKEQLYGYREELNTLEKKVADAFSEILAKQDEFIIFAEEDLENDTPEDYLEYRNDVTGNVIDVHPLKVNKFGIHVIDVNDTQQKFTIRLSDLGDLRDRINLCELMEITLQ